MLLNLLPERFIVLVLFPGSWIQDTCHDWRWCYWSWGRQIQQPFSQVISNSLHPLGFEIPDCLFLLLSHYFTGYGFSLMSLSSDLKYPICHCCFYNDSYHLNSTWVFLSNRIFISLLSRMQARIAGGADLFICYGGVQLREGVAAKADWLVFNFKDLINALG